MDLSNILKFSKYSGITDLFKKQEEKRKRLEQLQQQFMQSYQPQRSFWGKIGSDIKIGLSTLPKMPGALWHTIKESASEFGGYDMSKPFWMQGKAYKERFPTYSDYLKKYYIPKVLKSAPFMLVPNLMQVANMPYVSETKFGKAIPDTPASDLANKFILDSYIRATGSFIYDPESKGRRWFPKPSEGTRYQQYREHPLLTGIEDIANIAIIAAPILKGAGVGAKLIKSPLGKAIRKSPVGQSWKSFYTRQVKWKSDFLNKIASWLTLQ